MSLHPDTVKILKENSNKFSNELNHSILKILDLIKNYSAMSDVNFLLHKYEVSIEAITLPTGEVSWLPIRNLARLIGYIASKEYTDKIEEINIKSMRCGCDYFEGNLSVKVGKELIEGPYKWQWTAFPSHERSYKQFLVFPEISEKIVQ